MEYPRYLDLGFGITRIDTGLLRPGMAACYLMAHQGHLAVIETGTGQTVPRVLDLIAELGFSPEQVDYVMVTHVHLDHAGGAGGLMEVLPRAKLVVHPRGARHMADPSQLQAGAMAVYGEDSFRQQYGELKAIPEDRIISAGEGFELTLGDRVLRFLDTPGHARHHYCIYDETSRGIFSGDTLGMMYGELCEGFEPFPVPSTSPVQFEPEVLKQSIDRLMSLQAERFFLTHYGMVEATPAFAERLKAQIDGYVAIAERCKDSDNRIFQMANELMDYTIGLLADHGSPLDEQAQRKLLGGEIGINAQGLEVWLQRMERKNSAGAEAR